MDSRKKGVFQKNEVVNILFSKEEVVTVGNRQRQIKVEVTRSYPVFLNPEDDSTTRGADRIEAVLSIDHHYLRLSWEEAAIVLPFLEEALPRLEASTEVLRAEREKRNNERKARTSAKSTEGGSTFSTGFSMGQGKTAREKAKGKAGPAVHKAHKAAKAEESRQIQQQMGRNK